jgi:predicted N-acetyltransferase YhbS
LGSVSFAAPRPLRPDDDFAGFDCGRDELNDWLVRRALRSERERDARTYVTCETAGGQVAGYYCLSAFSVVRSTAPGSLSRNAPDPVPAVLLGRLAVDRRFQGEQLGASLLHDAVLNATTAAERIGLRALIVDALDDAAAAFYVRHGFRPFAVQPLRLFHRL